MKQSVSRRSKLKPSALALVLGFGVMGSAQAQTIIEVGGAGTIGDDVLATNTVPVSGGNWTASGGDGGIKYSSLDSPTVQVANTGAVTLTFTHRYDFESDYDGGVVFVNVNGAGFVKVPLASFTANGYNAAINGNTAWPTGEEVFNGTSTDYGIPTLITSVADLGTLNATDTVAVQFRGGWDDNTNGASPNWEIGTVAISDTGATLLDVDFTADGTAGFTASTSGPGSPSSPWTYEKPTNRFEIDADLLTSDRYAPTTPGDVIDLAGGNIQVEILTGTLNIGDSFTLFDLTGGTMLSGSVGTLSLPAGAQWDTSSLATNGTITVRGTANPLINESFADLDPSLNGNTPGTGLTGTWSSGALVANSSLTYGKLGYQGGRVVSNPANSVESGTVNPGTTLTDAGLMADGATLWFSVLIKKYPDTSTTTNDRTTYFSLGTGGPDGFDRIGGNTGSGFALVVNQNNAGLDRLQLWNNNSDGAGGAEKRSPLMSWGPEGSTILAVGKITWGEFNVTDDVFELYLPDKDLNLGPVIDTLTGNFDQLGTVAPANAFSTIGFAGKRGATGENNTPEIDEFRFAADVADVLPLDFTAPVLVATDNASGSKTQRVATFDEEIYAGTGDIRIVNETTPGTTTITLPNPQVVFVGNTLTVTPTVPLIGGDTYHIEIDAGAVTDRNLNGFAGISSPTEWVFTADGTPPTVASFGDNTFPKPVLTNTSTLTYTVTFSEPMNPGTVEITDFGVTAGSVSATIDSVTPTGDPAVFEVGVSTGGSPGPLRLEIVASAVISDVVGNDLVTTTAIPSDNTLTVNNPTPTAASIGLDFQGTIASEQNANNLKNSAGNTNGEGRYFHVSVNPANAGTGWYCADLPNSGTDGPPGFRNYGGDVVAYKFLGGTTNSINGVTGSGGEPNRITYTTPDVAFDGFAQQQLRLWATNDPGADLASGAGTGATGFDNVGNFGYRSFGGAVGTIDISGLESGSLHIYYGSFSATPSVKVTLKDTDNVAADLVLNDAHSVADGGTGDAANRTEYYLAEIDFVTDGFYDVIEFEWLANGVDYTGNGRGLGAVLAGPEPVSDYNAWASLYPAADLSDPDADNDGDGLTNDEERLFGLNPTSGASMDPFTVALDSGAGTFSFTRRDPSLTGLFTDIETSTDLAMWTKDSGAMLTVSGTVDNVQTVDVVLSPGLLTATKLFVRVDQNDGTVFSANFEDDNGGFTVVGAPNDWEYGTPNANNGAGLTLTSGNGGSMKCWATVLGTDGLVGAGGITAASDSILRSPNIDIVGAAGAQLQFAAAIDSQSGDTLEILVKEVGSDALLETVNPVTPPSSDTGWKNYGPFAIPGAANKNVYLEFRFVGTDADYIGFYLDDVTVQKTP